MRTLLGTLLLGLAAFCFGQVHNPTLNPDGTLNKTAGLGIDQKLGAQVPSDITLVDESGQKVNFGQFLGKRPVLLNLIFYRCPGVCSLELEGLMSSLAKMSHEGSVKSLVGQDVDVVTVSIDPNEGPDLAAAKKQSVVSMFGYPSAAQGWHFLTGDLDNIDKLCSAVGFNFVYNKDTKQINHPAGIMLLSPDGHVSQYFYGSGYPEKPLHDAILRAQRNEVGEKAEVVLLGCLSHDALTGKYSVNVMQTARLLGVVTLLIVIVSIVRMNLKSKREDPFQLHYRRGDDPSA